MSAVLGRTVMKLAVAGCLVFPTASFAAEDPLCATLKILTDAAYEKGAPFYTFTSSHQTVRIGTGEPCRQVDVGSERIMWACDVSNVRMAATEEKLTPDAFTAAYMQKAAAVLAAGQAIVPRIAACIGPFKQQPAVPSDMTVADIRMVSNTQSVLWERSDGVKVELAIEDSRMISIGKSDPIFAMTAEVRVSADVPKKAPHVPTDGGFMLAP